MKWVTVQHQAWNYFIFLSNFLLFLQNTLNQKFYYWDKLVFFQVRIASKTASCEEKLRSLCHSCNRCFIARILNKLAKWLTDLFPAEKWHVGDLHCWCGGPRDSCGSYIDKERDFFFILGWERGKVKVSPWIKWENSSHQNTTLPEVLEQKKMGRFFHTRENG